MTGRLKGSCLNVEFVKVGNENLSWNLPGLGLNLEE